MRERFINLYVFFQKANRFPQSHSCITDDEYKSLQERLLVDKEKSPVDFSQRILTRIFSNGRFDQGGRFYRAWWHNVPSEYRKYITINGKRTCEYDYSQLNPHMAYYLRGADIGSEDAYSRVFDGEPAGKTC